MKKNIQPEQNIPIFFLHGFSGEAKSLKQFAALHSGENAHCIDLPGFGGTPPPSDEITQDFSAYCELVWTQIRKIEPNGKVVLVGHSYGAMVAFVLATRHQNEIARLDLYYPVASPRLPSRLAANIVNYCQKTKMPSTLLVRTLSKGFFVDFVTKTMSNPNWDEQTKQSIAKMRRSESKLYSPSMFKLIVQSLKFRSNMKNASHGVPTRICFASDDNVAGKNDATWYETRSQTIQKVSTIGGHLAIIAEPKRIADIFEGSNRAKT